VDPIGVVESTVCLDVLRKRSVYLNQPLLRKRSVAVFRGELKGGSFMSRTFHHGERRIRARGVRHGEPDLRKLARALIDLAQAQAEAEAEKQHKERSDNVVDLRPKKPASPEQDAA
jgi:hypothetical protein